jgi:ATP-dependent Zn protease
MAAPNQPEWHTAYHEAGHVVVYLAEGLSGVDDNVSIVADEERGLLGRFQHAGVGGFHYRNATERKDIVRSLLKVTYGGKAAEKRFDADAPNSHWEDDFSDALSFSIQHEMFGNFCRYAEDEGHHKYLRRLEGQARKIVRDHWAAVERLAAELMQRHAMTLEEVKQAIEPLMDDE